jgi:hypothetical protein
MISIAQPGLNPCASAGSVCSVFYCGGNATNLRLVPVQPISNLLIFDPLKPWNGVFRQNHVAIQFKEMTRLLIYITFLLILQGCNQTEKSRFDSDKDMHDSINLSSKNGTVITYWQPDFDTITKKQKIQIENIFYELTIKSYCLNDSSISRKSDYDKSKVVYHDYKTEIILTIKSDTVLISNVTKETFSDSLSGDFYKYTVLTDVEYAFVRSNRIYFKALLNVSGSDWVVESEFAIFFRTNKKGQINYWNFKDVK